MMSLETMQLGKSRNEKSYNIEKKLTVSDNTVCSDDRSINTAVKKYFPQNISLIFDFL